MANIVNRFLLALLPVAALISAPSAALADDDEDAEYAAPPPPMGPAPVYVAPLAQTTQSTYVPQSIALSGPDEINAEEGRRAPDGYTTVYRKRLAPLIGGGATFAVSYGISVMTAAIGHDIGSYGEDKSNPVAAMWIPVAGPWLQITQQDSAMLGLVLAGLGAAQVTGAVLLYYGMTSKKRVFVRNDIVGNLNLSPMVSDGMQGMAVSGRF